MAGASTAAFDPIRTADDDQQTIEVKFIRNLIVLAATIAASSAFVCGQTLTRELTIQPGQIVEVVNLYGRVDLIAVKADANDETKAVGLLTANSKTEIVEKEIINETVTGRLKIKIAPATSSKRIDVVLNLPERTRVIAETRDGEIRVAGDFESADAKTETGTIASDTPLYDLRYNLLWTASRPRHLADFTLAKMKERSRGRFEIKGTHSKDGEKVRQGDEEKEPVSGNGDIGNEEKPKTKVPRPKTISLNFTTARGIILLNVPPNEVSSDLRERPLTEAAKAIVRSGDSYLLEAIRRASPKYFGDYSSTLPPVRREPSLLERAPRPENPNASIKTVTARVTDLSNRAIPDLQPSDFIVTEADEQREVLSVRPVTAPFNLVLLVDVSGSVDNYVNFIRKAARAFVDTVDSSDRVSIVLFNDDIKVLSGFTTDKAKLSKSLDTFDAGGSTAYYDALAYTLADTLRPMRGERTAIVVLTDGDDNRSFLAFDSLMGSIQESGALIYPLYVPSALVAESASADLNAAIDPLRSKYLNVSLTSKAQAEGPRLAQASGGVYYPITQLAQIQTAYDDIVAQLRTAYDVTFRSALSDTTAGSASPRLKVRVKKPNSFVSLGKVSVAR